MSEIECPYCGADCGEDCEPGDEGELNQRECGECEKLFVYYPQYSIDFYSNKAPCLNGEDHKWRKREGYPTEYFAGKYECEWCNERRTVEEEK